MMFSFVVGGNINRYKDFRGQSGGIYQFLKSAHSLTQQFHFWTLAHRKNVHRSTQDMQTKDVHWGLFCNSEHLETSVNE